MEAFLNIIKDIFNGIYDSTNLANSFYIFGKNSILSQNLLKLIGFNLIFNILIPIFIESIFDYRISTLNAFFLVLNQVINNVHLIEISMTITNLSSNKIKVKLHDMIEITFVMLQIQLLMYFSSIFIYLITPLIRMFQYYKKLEFLLNLIAIVLQCFYHSFYYYELKWKASKTKLQTRIVTFEKSWAYFLGLGLLPSLIGNSSYLPFFGIYNIYLAFFLTLSSNPLKIDNKYPRVNSKYITAILSKIIK